MYRDALSLAAYCSLIFYLSHQSTLPVAMAFEHQDKLVHATAYGLMAGLAWRCFRHYIHANRALLLMALLFCSAYGMSDEYHQSFIQGRDADILDWLADTVGASLVLFFLFWLRLRQKI